MLNILRPQNDPMPGSTEGQSTYSYIHNQIKMYQNDYNLQQYLNQQKSNLDKAQIETAAPYVVLRDMKERAIKALQQRGASELQIERLLEEFEARLRLIGKESDAQKQQERIRLLQQEVKEHTGLDLQQREIRKAADSFTSSDILSDDNIPAYMTTQTVVGQTQGQKVPYAQVVKSTNITIKQLQQQIQLNNNSGNKQKAKTLTNQCNQIIYARANLDKIQQMDQEYYQLHGNRDIRQLTLETLIQYFQERRNTTNANYLRRQGDSHLTFNQFGGRFWKVLEPIALNYSPQQSVQSEFNSNNSSVGQPINVNQSQYNNHSGANYANNYGSDMFNYNSNYSGGNKNQNVLSDEQQNDNNSSSLMNFGCGGSSSTD